MNSQYDKYIFNPPHRKFSLKSDNSVVFDGLMINQATLGYNFTIGHQFVRKPFKGDNPCHTHNFQEYLAWYSGNPDDPDDFGAEVVFYFGKELVKYVFTRPTLVVLPPGVPHCPLEITRVDRPIIQVEVMLSGPDGTRDPYFEKDQGFNPQKVMNFETIPYKKA
jgi:hypothetical protein